eukprot:4356851-Amphidinium_carterae.1
MPPFVGSGPIYSQKPKKITRNRLPKLHAWSIGEILLLLDGQERNKNECCQQAPEETHCQSFTDFAKMAK